MGQFSLIDTITCRQYVTYIEDTCIVPRVNILPAEDFGVWYPDNQEGLCRNDGNQPPYVTDLSVSYQACCRQSFPGNRQDCNEKSLFASTGYSIPSPTPGSGSVCDGMKPRKCNEQSACEYNIGRDRCVKKTQPPPPLPPSPMTSMSSNGCKGLRKGPCRSKSGCEWDGACSLAPPPPAPTPPTSVLDDYCSKMPKKLCIRQPQCQWKKHSGPEACSAADELGAGSVPGPAPTNKGEATVDNGNPYYPDTVNMVCKNDGKQKRTDERYDDIEGCCRSQWVSYKTCIKHAKGTQMVPGVSNGGGEGDNSHNNQMVQGVDNGSGGSFDVITTLEGDASDNNGHQGNHNPYYPDYFYNVCRNDGNQSPLESNLFDELKDCCSGNRYLDYNTCMSNAGG